MRALLEIKAVWLRIVWLRAQQRLDTAYRRLADADAEFNHASSWLHFQEKLERRAKEAAGRATFEIQRAERRRFLGI